MKTQILFHFFYSFLSFFSLTIILLHNISTLEVPIIMTTSDDKFMTSFNIFSATNSLPHEKLLMGFSSSADFCQNKLFRKFFQENHLNVKLTGSRSGPMRQAGCLIGPDLGPICLQNFSADDTRRQRAKT